MVTTRREFLKSTSVAYLATAASTPLLNSKSAAQVSSPVPVKMVQTPVLDIGYEEHGPEAVSYTHLTLPTILLV